MPLLRMPAKFFLCVSSLFVVWTVGGCGEGGNSEYESHAGSPPREIVHLSLDDRAEVQAPDQDLVMDTDEPREGVASLHVFASGLRKIWIWDGDAGEMTGDQIRVKGWARTQVMQRPVELQLIMIPDQGDPRVLPFELTEVTRTTPWTMFQARFAVPEGLAVRRLRLGMLIPEPGQLWLDDITILDESQAGP